MVTRSQCSCANEDESTSSHSIYARELYVEPRAFFRNEFELIHEIQLTDVSTQGGILAGVQDWLAESVNVVEETVGGVVDLLKGAVGSVPILGEEARLKGKYAAQQADAIHGTVSASGTSALVRSRFIRDLIVQFAEVHFLIFR